MKLPKISLNGTKSYFHVLWEQSRSGSTTSVLFFLGQMQLGLSLISPTRDEITNSSISNAAGIQMMEEEDKVSQVKFSSRKGEAPHSSRWLRSVFPRLQCTRITWRSGNVCSTGSGARPAVPYFQQAFGGCDAAVGGLCFE